MWLPIRRSTLEVTPVGKKNLLQTLMVQHSYQSFVQGSCRVLPVRELPRDVLFLPRPDPAARHGRPLPPVLPDLSLLVSQKVGAVLCVIQAAVTLYLRPMVPQCRSKADSRQSYVPRQFRSCRLLCMFFVSAWTRSFGPEGIVLAVDSPWWWSLSSLLLKDTTAVPRFVCWCSRG